MPERFVYADNAATTAVGAPALAAMKKVYEEEYGNPSSMYSVARNARRILEDARRQVAEAIGAQPEEIYFTSGGTESDNWAIRSAAKKLRKKGNHIITTAIEHHAVLYTCQDLEKEGFEVTYLPVNDVGQLDLEQLKAAIRPETILISVMTANNEIGTILPIAEIGAIAREHGILFHTDAVQAMGHMEIRVDDLQVDLLSMSAHKFHGPKGIGVLYMRRGVRLPAMITGGGQERNLRSGTENVAGAAGLAAALTAAVTDLQPRMAQVAALRDRLIKGVLTGIPYSRLTGDPVNRLPGTASFVIPYIEGESMILMLDANGICGSSGSACSSGSLDPSHVLLAIGLPHEIAHGSLRLTIDDSTTEEDVDYIVDKLTQIVQRLRSMSPLWEQVSAGQQ